MRHLLLFSMMMVAACQTAPKPAAPKMETWEQHIRSRPDTFIQGYEQHIAKTRGELARKGLATDHAAIRAYVDAFLPAGNYTLQATGANAAVLRRLRVENVTNNLVLYGYSQGQFADAAQAKRLVRAAAGVFGASVDGDLATFAPTVVVADLVSADDAADGSSALIYRVVEPIKNAPAKGQAIRLTLRGAQASSPFPPPPQPGEGELRLPGRVALFLSPPRVVGGSRDARDSYSRITQPMRLDGDRLTPGYHSDIPETTLSKLKAAVREQVCAPGFVPVGKAGGTSLAC